MASGTKSLSLFQELEERVLKLLDEVRRLRVERESALARQNEAQAEIRRLREQLEQFDKDRGRIRDRVESLLHRMSDLDQRKKIG
jgi:chromosome segregation ATPase